MRPWKTHPWSPGCCFLTEFLGFRHPLFGNLTEIQGHHAAIDAEIRADRQLAEQVPRCLNEFRAGQGQIRGSGQRSLQIFHGEGNGHGGRVERGGEVCRAPIPLPCGKPERRVEGMTGSSRQIRPLQGSPWLRYPANLCPVDGAVATRPFPFRRFISKWWPNIGITSSRRRGHGR